MAKCGICSEDVLTNNYVRAKAMVPVKGREGRYESAPGDEHLFFCTLHGREAIAQAVSEALKPSAGVSVRLLWNPGLRDFRIASRAQRVREKLGKMQHAEVGKMQHAEVVIVAITREEDRRAGVSVRGVGVQANDGLGLRMVTVQSPAAIKPALTALLAEGS